MCGRFAQAIPLGKLKKIDLFNDLTGDVSESYNVTPGENAAIIYFNQKPEMTCSKWGLAGPFHTTGRGPRLIINARSESVSEKFFFKKAFRNSRCVVPVSGFYEWKSFGRIKTPWFIYSNECESPDFIPLFLAGIYLSSAEGGLTFAVITRESSGQLCELHDRMPVVIPDEKLFTWLNPESSPDELLQLMHSGFFKEFKMHNISGAVNNTSDKSIECVKPAV